MTDTLELAVVDGHWRKIGGKRVWIPTYTDSRTKQRESSSSRPGAALDAAARSTNATSPSGSIRPGKYHVKNGTRVGKAHMIVKDDGSGTYVNSRGDTKPLSEAAVKKNFAAGMNSPQGEAPKKAVSGASGPAPATAGKSAGGSGQSRSAGVPVKPLSPGFAKKYEGVSPAEMSDEQLATAIREVGDSNSVYARALFSTQERRKSGELKAPDKPTTKIQESKASVKPGQYRASARAKAYVEVKEDGTAEYVNSRGERKALSPKALESNLKNMEYGGAAPPAATAPFAPSPAPRAPAATPDAKPALSPVELRTGRFPLNKEGFIPLADPSLGTKRIDNKVKMALAAGKPLPTTGQTVDLRRGAGVRSMQINGTAEKYNKLGDGPFLKTKALGYLDKEGKPVLIDGHHRTTRTWDSGEAMPMDVIDLHSLFTAEELGAMSDPVRESVEKIIGESPATPAPNSTAAKAEDKPDRTWRSKKVRRTREQVQPLADKLTEEIKRLNPGLEFHFGGSWRRGSSTIGDLDVVFITKDGSTDGVKLPPSVSLQRDGSKIAQGDMTIDDVTMHVDFWSASEKERGAFLWFMTGPKELNIAMRAEAKSKGLQLSQIGLLDKEGKQLDDGTEESVSKILDPGGKWNKFLKPESRDSWAAPQGDVEKIQIPSSQAGKFYTIERQGDRYKCQCTAYKFRKKCSHIEKAKAEFAKSDAGKSSPAAEAAAQAIAPKSSTSVAETAPERVRRIPTSSAASARAHADPAKTAAPPTSASTKLDDYKPMTYMELDASADQKGTPTANFQKFIDDDDYIFQQKIDGHRGTLVIEPGKAPWMKAKHGRRYNQATNNPLAKKITDAAAKLNFGDQTFMVDGEMLDGKYHVFDLVIPGQESMPWEQRMKVAQKWVESMGMADQIVALPAALGKTDKTKMWYDIYNSGREGVVIKRKSAPYKPTTSSGAGGKSAEIIKAKAWRTADVVVTDIGVGTSSGATGGAKDNVLFGVWENGKMIPVGGAALAGREKRMGGQIKVGDVIEVRYLDANPQTFALKQPQVISIRRDKTKDDTGTAQLQTVDKTLLDKAAAAGTVDTAKTIAPAKPASSAPSTPKPAKVRTSEQLSREALRLADEIREMGAGDPSLKSVLESRGVTLEDLIAAELTPAGTINVKVPSGSEIDVSTDLARKLLGHPRRIA